MKSRNESIIYHDMEIDLWSIRKFRSDNRKIPGKVKFTAFHIILAAWVRTIALRPQFNRFITGQRIYQRNRIQFAFVFKKDSSNEASHESTIKIDFSPFDTVYDVADKVMLKIAKGRNEGTKGEELANFFGSAPRFLLNTAIRMFKLMDYYNIAPWFVIKDDPMYSSIFFTNLGSVGMNAPHHHLFEWGNTSLFVVIGEPERKVIPSETNMYEVRTIIPIKTSIDDRISEGMYCAKTMRMFKHFCEHPDELAEKPDISSEIMREHNFCG